ncbi:hypothetical protein C802_04307 [Phocaeicola sartorii]|jgi:hypothetical protein|uniref:Uncharacterized protein n=1 Tax=Phocaeicola sartorii TaxID=671267 RepID=R9I646_9BACT|nr:hypothetical protein C802_04307 [Phocaeicola sartorii]
MDIELSIIKEEQYNTNYGGRYLRCFEATYQDFEINNKCEWACSVVKTEHSWSYSHNYCIAR